MSTDTHPPGEQNGVYLDPARYRFGDQRNAKDPFDLWKRFRETPGLVRSEQDGGFWIVSRFDEVRQVAAQEKTFCARRGRVIPAHPGTFLPSDTDGALHRQYRRILNRWLSAEAVAPLETNVHATCAGLLAALSYRRDFDMSQDYTIPAASLSAIQWLLGWPGDDGEQLAAWAHDIMAAEEVAGPGASARAWSELSVYITGQLALRADGPRREDTIQGILDAEIDGRPVTHDEALQLIISVFLGAVHTTASTLSYSLHYLANHPEARDLLRSEPVRLELAVEEFLRTAGTVVYIGRTADQDTQLAGCPLHDGDKVAMMFSSANRDPAEFPDPDDVILDRSPNRHLAFGHGAHKCAGAPFARLVLRVAIEAALAQLGEFQVGDVEQVRWETSMPRVVASLPVVHQPR
jgi:cytochrome P450